VFQPRPVASLVAGESDGIQVEKLAEQRIRYIINSKKIKHIPDFYLKLEIKYSVSIFSNKNTVKKFKISIVSIALLLPNGKKMSTFALELENQESN